ncbi:MAG: hypothetical protein WD042_14470 [Phycisphaeraceae bacterium]
MSARNPRQSRHRLFALVACLTLVGLTCPDTLWADAVKLGGFWIDDQVVQSINDGKLSYVNSAGTEAVRGLEEVQGIKLSAFPDLGKAEDLIQEKKDLSEAMRLLTAVRGNARQEWLRQWVDYRLVVAADLAERPVDAVRAYVTVLQANPHAFYLQQAPTTSLTQIKNEQIHQAALKLVDEALPRLKGPAQEAANTFREALAEAYKPEGAAGAPGAPGGENGVAGAPAEDAGGLALPKVMPANDPVAKLLKQGKYAEAIATTDRAMAAESGTTQMRLYQKGIAQLQIALALAQEDTLRETQLKDAGLSLMRVVVHFGPRGSYVGPAMLGAGIVHQQIGRTDTALTLYNDAANLIDPEDTGLINQVQELKRSIIAGEEPATTP